SLLKQVIESPQSLLCALDARAEFELGKFGKPCPQSLVEDESVCPDVRERPSSIVDRITPLIWLVANEASLLDGHPFLKFGIKRRSRHRLLMKMMPKQRNWPIQVAFQRMQENLIGRQSPVAALTRNDVGQVADQIWKEFPLDGFQGLGA